MKSNKASEFQDGFFIASIISGPLVAEEMAHAALPFTRMAVAGCVSGVFAFLVLWLAGNLRVRRVLAENFSVEKIAPFHAGLFAAAIMLGLVVAGEVAQDSPVGARIALAGCISDVAMFLALSIAVFFHKPSQVFPACSQEIRKTGLNSGSDRRRVNLVAAPRPQLIEPAWAVWNDCRKKEHPPFS
jgi:hypothetical protein